jgi:acetolactate synthase-1/2/3 large subunit
VVRALQAAVGPSFLWARDVTVSNSTWGNRELRLAGPRDGVHATGGGIGQGLAMAVGAAVGEAVAAAEGPAGAPRRTWCLAGDGGFTLNVGELATAVQEQADLTIVLMNDRGYGVIRNIQDAQYGGRRCYVDLHTPDFETLCAAMGVAYRRVNSADDAAEAFAARPPGGRGPLLVEVDMTRVGAFATAFAGPPVKAGASSTPKAGG